MRSEAKGKLLSVMWLGLWLGGCDSSNSASFTTQVTTPAQRLGRTSPYTGSAAFSEEFLPAKVYPEPLYLKRIRVRVTDRFGTEISRETEQPLAWWDVCWVNRERHGELLDRPSDDADSLVRLPGSERELDLPAGYGIPLMSNEPLVFRGSWITAPAGPRKQEYQAELTMTFQRPNGELVKPLICRTGWAGQSFRVPSAGDPETWTLGPGEPNRGSFFLPPDAQVVLKRWFLGPGAAAGLEKPSVRDKGAWLQTIESSGGMLIRPSALGLNLYLLDSRWKGFP